MTGRKLKVAILHDYFNKRGGGERLALRLAEMFDADIYTGFVDKKNTYDEISNFNVTEIGRNVKNPGLRVLYLMKKFNKLVLKGYDLFIFSGTSCITASEKNHPNILYCHTPPRYLYDLGSWFEGNTNVIERLGLEALRKYAFPKDQFYMRQFDKIITNSKEVKKRLLRYYDNKVYNKADVVYSFVDLKKFKWMGQSDYYLSYGRLDRLKRIDTIIKAFQKMPEKKLVVASSGPLHDTIKDMAKGYDNIEFRGLLSETELQKTLGKCISTIYIPINEDMGLIPVESMACGKPCIGANEGGLRETIINNKTGFLINPDIHGVINAVKQMNPEKAIKMRKECEKRSKFFSQDSFSKRIQNVVKETLEKYNK